MVATRSAVPYDPVPAMGVTSIAGPAKEDVIMHRTRRMAAVLALGIGIAASSAGLATPALAAQARPAGMGSFRSWPAAQAAAGFRLAKPTRTYGLARSGRIIVSRCEVKRPKPGVRDVNAVYGDTPNANLTINQNNSRGSCGVIGKSTKLGRYKVNGVWASLTGECGLRGLPSCKSRKIFLFLTWRKHGAYYRASAHDEPRLTIVGFARSLVPVR